MLERKSKVTEDVREDEQSYRGCSGVKTKLQKMLERKSNITENVREERKVTKDVREEN